MSEVPGFTVGTPTGLRYKHYLNLALQDWYLSSHQADTEDRNKVRNKDLPTALQRTGKIPFMPGLLYVANELIAHFILR